jgi:hypothetical protein
MSQGQKLSRREMVERLLAGATAGVMWPMIAASHPFHRFLADQAAFDRADLTGAAANWEPIFLSQRQNEFLVELAESIVPGSSQARVNRFIDLLLSVDTNANQNRFAASLAAMQTASQDKFDRTFAQLNPAEKVDLLQTASSNPTTRQQFDELKEWISLAYYSSERGMRELGWTEEHAFRSFPECTNDKAHLTD